MWNKLRTWLNRSAFSEPLEQRQASFLQLFLLIAIAACCIGAPLALLTSTTSAAGIFALIVYALLFTCALVGLFLLRRGNLELPVLIVAGGLITIISFSIAALGLTDSEAGLLGFAIPVVLCGLLAGRRGIIISVLLTVTLLAIIAIVSTYKPAWVGFAHSQDAQPVGIVVPAAISLFVVGFLLDRFGSSLRTALLETRARERELEVLRDSLEAIVAQRTASLQESLEHGERREEHLARTLEELQANQALVRQMSSPVLPVLNGVLLAPIIGILDDTRAESFEQTILERVEQQRTRYVIIDITGVPLIDTQVAHILLRLSVAVRLLGAQTILVGVRPEVAQTLVMLGVRLDEIPTYADLREAVAVLAGRATVYE